MARHPLTVLRLLPFARRSHSSTGCATARRQWLWHERCGRPSNSAALALTKASCWSDLHPRTGLSQDSAPCRANASKRRPAWGARASQGAAHHPRWPISARTTSKVACPFAGCRPSIVHPNDVLAREAPLSRAGACCRAASSVWDRPRDRSMASSDHRILAVSFHAARSCGTDQGPGHRGAGQASPTRPTPDTNGACCWTMRLRG